MRYTSTLFVSITNLRYLCSLILWKQIIRISDFSRHSTTPATLSDFISSVFVKNMF